MKYCVRCVLKWAPLLLILCSSCFKQDYNGPPDNSNYDPHLAVTHTIAQLLQKPVQQVITEDMTLCGVVVMNDKSGNYFKKIVVQDSTGGIALVIDGNNLSNDYPLGRKLYIRCKGLYRCNSGGEPQLGYAPDADGAATLIPGALAGQCIVKADRSLVIAPDTVTVSQLSGPAADLLINRLIVLKGMEFVASDTSVPYARPAATASSTWRYLEDCSGSGISLRTSAYATFQSCLTPAGSGLLVALFTKYRDQPQLYIRDTSDMHFSGPRCPAGSSSGITLFSEDFSSLADNSEIALAGWNNIAVSGGRRYTRSSYQADWYARISASGVAASAVVETWLITPLLDCSDGHNVRLLFKTKDGYDNGATLKACYSLNYSGSGDPAAAAWTDLDAAVSKGAAGGYASQWTEAIVPLPSKVLRIAFRYEGGEGRTTTYNLGYIRVLSD